MDPNGGVLTPVNVSRAPLGTPAACIVAADVFTNAACSLLFLVGLVLRWI